jgi:hypothetical protein
VDGKCREDSGERKKCPQQVFRRHRISSGSRHVDAVNAPAKQFNDEEN